MWLFGWRRIGQALDAEDDGYRYRQRRGYLPNPHVERVSPRQLRKRYQPRQELISGSRVRDEPPIPQVCGYGPHAEHDYEHADSQRGDKGFTENNGRDPEAHRDHRKVLPQARYFGR
jgi:hypothetical protein